MNKKRVEPIAKIRQPLHRPEPDDYAYRWTEGNANPWQMRDSNDFDSREWFASTILTDGNWWSAVWEDIVYTHGPIKSDKFWESFWTPKAITARQKALSGTTNYNWGEAIVAFNTARHEDHCERIIASTIGENSDNDPIIFERMREDSNGPEAISAHKKNLGEWLYRVIRKGETRHLENLAKLMREKKQEREKSPPRKQKLNREQNAVLEEFARLVFEEKSLPTKKILEDTQQSWNDFRKTLKALGLSGLPQANAKKK